MRHHQIGRVNNGFTPRFQSKVDTFEARCLNAFRALEAYDFGNGVVIDETDEGWEESAKGNQLCIGVILKLGLADVHSDGDCDEEVPYPLYETVNFTARFNPGETTISEISVKTAA